MQNNVNQDQNINIDFIIDKLLKVKGHKSKFVNMSESEIKYLIIASKEVLMS